MFLQFLDTIMKHLKLNLSLFFSSLRYQHLQALRSHLDSVVRYNGVRPPAIERLLLIGFYVV